MDDSVAVDAKRILLRYGAPIAMLDAIGEAERIQLAREVSRTPVPERGDRLQHLLVEMGFMDASQIRPTRGRRKARK